MKHYYNVYKVLPYGNYGFTFDEKTIQTIQQCCIATILNSKGLIESAIIPKDAEFYFKVIENKNNEDLSNYYNLIIGRKYRIRNGNIELLPLKWYERVWFHKFISKFKWLKKLLGIVITAIIGILLGIYFPGFFNSLISLF